MSKQDGIECAFTGVTGQDLTELRTAPSGVKWGAVSVAVVTGEKDGEPETTWVRVSVFAKVAEHLVGQLPKGSRVYVRGMLKLGEWVDKQSQEKRAQLQVSAREFVPTHRIGKDRLKAPKQDRTEDAPSTLSA